MDEWDWVKECRAVTPGTFFFCWFESNLNVSPFLCDQPQALVFNFLFACCTNIFLTIFPKRARLQTLMVFWDSGFCRVPTASCLNLLPGILLLDLEKSIKKNVFY